jgi:Pyruvate/2-oxoacid:ferredoxin oxidoreductase delta subunit
MNMKIPFIKSSTLEFIREARQTPHYSLFDFLHGYVYARWPYLYIGVGKGKHPLAKKFAPLGKFANNVITKPRSDEPDGGVEFADTYHGKVVPLESASQLVMIQEDINIADLEQVIPYKRARSIVMKNPDKIVALECPCRAAMENPCLPLDVCLIIGDPIASFIIEHHPDRSRWISREEAVQILKEEDDRGHVHHAFFKDAMLEKFYAICNCCACCCGAMNIHQKGIPMLASSGYVSVVDESLCESCGDCEAYCQFGALEMGAAAMTVNYEVCMGCGICVGKCEQGAISLVADEKKGIPLEIFSLVENVS